MAHASRQAIIRKAERLNTLKRILLGACLLYISSLVGVANAEDLERLRLATTTSTENSGLLEYILPELEKKTRLKLDVIAVGTGKALKLAENGDVDVILVHAPAAEKAFMEAGFGVNRRLVMQNDFILVGPPEDPAGLKRCKELADAIRVISKDSRAVFISRGDESGTHKKEKFLWKKFGAKPPASRYLEIGQGMDAGLRVADEKRAYTLCDRATYLALKDSLELGLLFEGAEELTNPYSVIAVNPARFPGTNYHGAMRFIAWLTSPEGQTLIGSYKKYGQILFHPLALTTGAGYSLEQKEKKRILDIEVFNIVGLSLRVSLFATLIAAILGVPLGLSLAAREFRGKRTVVMIMNTLFSLPTVVVGLFVYAQISRSGWLGGFNLLYTPFAIIIGQVILALPIITALTYAATQDVDARVRPTAQTLGANTIQAALAVLSESRAGILAAVASGFGRVIAEVGSALMLGGNIKDLTRTMTTYIALETSKGEFARSILLGVILLSVALAVNILIHRLLRERRR